MSKARPSRRSGCPISYSLDFFGDKWSLLVIRDLMFKGKRRYSEFLKSDEAIATNILADRLERLEAAGIIERIEDSKESGKGLYSLTGKGLDLTPVMLELVVWGYKHDPKSAAPKAFVDRVVRDREGLIREIRANHTRA